jgi:hypothetical protein
MCDEDVEAAGNGLGYGRIGDVDHEQYRRYFVV